MPAILDVSKTRLGQRDVDAWRKEQVEKIEKEYFAAQDASKQAAESVSKPLGGRRETFDVPETTQQAGISQGGLPPLEASVMRFREENPILRALTLATNKNVIRKGIDMLGEKVFGPDPLKQEIVPRNRFERGVENIGSNIIDTVIGARLAQPLAGAVGGGIKSAAKTVADAAKGLPTWAKAAGGATAGVSAVNAGMGAFTPDKPDRNFMQQTGASLRAGTGHTLELAGSAAKWQGWDELSEKLGTAGQKVKKGYETQPTKEFSWRSFFDPEFYAVNAAQSLPLALSFIPAMYAGYKVGGAAAVRAGMKPFGQALVSSLTGASFSRPLEAALAAGAAYEAALEKDMSRDDAEKVGDEVFKKHSVLLGLDAAQLAAAFAPAPFKAATKMGKAALGAGRLGVGAATEAGEEGYQEVIQRQALGEDVAFDPQMQEAMAIGGLFGLGFGAAGVAKDHIGRMQGQTPEPPADQNEQAMRMAEQIRAIMGKRQEDTITGRMLGNIEGPKSPYANLPVPPLPGTQTRPPSQVESKPQEIPVQTEIPVQPAVPEAAATGRTPIMPYGTRAEKYGTLTDKRSMVTGAEGVAQSPVVYDSKGRRWTVLDDTSDPARIKVRSESGAETWLGKKAVKTEPPSQIESQAQEIAPEGVIPQETVVSPVAEPGEAQGQGIGNQDTDSIRQAYNAVKQSLIEKTGGIGAPEEILAKEVADEWGRRQGLKPAQARKQFRALVSKVMAQGTPEDISFGNVRDTRNSLGRINVKGADFQLGTIRVEPARETFKDPQVSPGATDAETAGQVASALDPPSGNQVIDASINDAEAGLSQKEPWQMTRDKYYAADEGVKDFLPKGTVKQIAVHNKNVNQSAPRGSGPVYITPEGFVHLDGRNYPVGSSAYLHEGRFYSAPPQELLDKVEEGISAHVNMLVEESAKIDRNAIVPEIEEDVLGIKFKMKDTSTRYRNLSGQDFNRRDTGEKIDAITQKHDPKAIHDAIFNKELELYRFDVGGMLHVLDETALTPKQRQALENYQAQGGRLGVTAVRALEGEAEAAEISKRVYDIDPAPSEHKKLVEQALKEGKPVPPEVLAEYPDLNQGTELPPAPPTKGSRKLKLAEKKTNQQEMPSESEVSDVSEDPPVKKSTASIVAGKTTTAKTERGTSIEAKYAVVSAGDLIASHNIDLSKNEAYPEEIQPRQRERAASEDQINRIAANLEPEFLGESPKASEGAPIVGPDLVVESGNGRVIALQRVFKNKKDNAEKYKKWLAENAEMFGLDKEAIVDINNPVLVRVRQTEVDRAKFAQEANEQSVAAMSATEQAKVDATKLTGGILDMFVPSETGEIHRLANADFIRGFMDKVVGPSERGRYVTADGVLSQEGITRIKNAIFARAYGDTSAISALAESTDNNVKNITNAMLIAAPKLAKVKEGIEQGDLHKLDITPDIAASMKKLSHLRDVGDSVQDYLSQSTLFGEEISDIAKSLLKLFDANKRHTKKISGVLNNYADAVTAIGNPKQETIFAKINPTKEETLIAAIRKVEKESGKVDDQASLFQDAAQDVGSEPDRKTTGQVPEKTGADGTGKPAGEVNQPAKAKENTEKEKPQETARYGEKVEIKVMVARGKYEWQPATIERVLKNQNNDDVYEVIREGHDFSIRVKEENVRRPEDRQKPAAKTGNAPNLEGDKKWGAEKEAQSRADIHARLDEKVDESIGDVTPPMGMSIKLVGDESGALKLGKKKLEEEGYQIENEEVRGRFEAAQGVPKEKLMQRLKNRLRLWYHLSTRVYQHLPRGIAEFAPLMNDLLTLAKQKGVASDRTSRNLQGILVNLDKKQYSIFRHYVILADLMEEMKAGHNLPFGFTQDILEHEWKRVKDAAKSEPDVQEAIADRGELWEKITGDYIEAQEKIGHHVEGKFDRKNYYRHQVLEYAQAQATRGTGKKLKTPSNRGFLKQRGGSALDINTDYLQAEFEVMSQMLYDIEVAKVIDRVNSRYNIQQSCEDAAEKHNAAALERLIRKEEAAHGESAIDKGMKKFKQRIAFGFSKLRGLAEQDALWTGDNGEYEDVVDRLASGVEDYDADATFRYLSDLLSRGDESAKAAATILKAVSNRAKFVEDALGKNFKTWEDMIPEGYVTWQPRQGNLFFFADTIPGHMAEKIYAQQISGMGIATADQLRKVLAVGGRRTEYVVKEEVALTLDELVRDQTESPWGEPFAKAQRYWKVWQLISPRRWFKYNFRNLTGDAEAIFVGNPQAFKYVPRSFKELYPVFVADKPMPAQMKDWFERGGMETLLYAQELGDVNELRVFSKLTDKQEGIATVPGKAWKWYWGKARMSTDMREAILRYAAYLSYLEQMQSNPEGRPDNFGASHREEVMALDDIKDRAFKMSNELLGAYDQVGVTGQNLRKYLVPFWSWNEVNFRRTKQLFFNAARDSGLAKAAARKVLGTMVVKSPILTYNIGKFVLKAMGLWTMLWLWNTRMWPDEEKSLPENVRSKPHIIFGRDADGKVVYFDRLGFIADFLEWFGLDEWPKDVADWLNGKRTLKEIATDMAKSPLNKAINGIGPLLKTPMETLLKVQLFPDAFKPRTVRDRWQFLSNSLGLGNEYRYLAGKPMQTYGGSRTEGYWKSWEQAFVYKADPGESAYFDILDEKRRFMKKLNKPEGYSTSPKSDALYNLKLAVRYKDKEAFEQYLSRYAELGGTAKGLEQSLKAMSPLNGLNKDEQKLFIDSLSTEGKYKALRAYQYYETVILGKDG